MPPNPFHNKKIYQLIVYFVTQQNPVSEVREKVDHRLTAHMKMMMNDGENYLVPTRKKVSLQIVSVFAQSFWIHQPSHQHQQILQAP